MTRETTETEQNLTNLFEMVRQTYATDAPDSVENLLNSAIQHGEKEVAAALAEKVTGYFNLSVQKQQIAKLPDMGRKAKSEERRIRQSMITFIQSVDLTAGRRTRQYGAQEIALPNRTRQHC